MRVECLAAVADNVLVAHAAFDAVVARYPERAISLRHGIRMIARSPLFAAAEERELARQQRDLGR